MPLTYNKVIQLSREFQQAQHQLNAFGNGSDFDTVLENTEGGIHYPLMWMEDLPMPLQEGVEVMSWRVGFLALKEQLENQEDALISTNRNEVISDMMQCAKDFVAYWVQDHTYNDFRIQKVAPRQTVEGVTADRLYGCYVDITFNQAFKYDKCAIPMSGITPPASTDVTITVNGVSFTVVECGTTYNVPVKDTDGNLVGSKIGGEWIVNVGGDPVGNTMNGAPLTDAVSGTTKAFTITYADLSAVTVTETSDTATAFVGTVPTPISSDVYYNIPYLTQTVSYNNYDEGWRRIDGQNSGNDSIPAQALIQQLKPQYANGRHDMLKYDNRWGHKFRFTGLTGGYYDEADGNYYDVNGVLSDLATEYPTVAIGGAWILDNLTGYKFPSVRFGSATWPNCMDETQTYSSFGGLQDYIPFTINESIQMNNSMDEVGSLINDTNRPFVLWTAGTHTTGTTRPGVSTQNFRYRSDFNAGDYDNSNKTSTGGNRWWFVIEYSGVI
jgi:hypothetical protein